MDNQSACGKVCTLCMFQGTWSTASVQDCCQYTWFVVKMYLITSCKHFIHLAVQLKYKPGRTCNDNIRG